jgi:hypothetical protein
MARKPAARPKTREQLKTTVWPDEASALRDLKASRVPPRGTDYALGEYRPGSWQLVIADAVEDLEPPPEVEAGREQRVIDSLKRKPGQKPRGEPEVILEAKAARIKPNGKHRPAPKKPAAKAQKAAAPQPPEPEPKPDNAESLFPEDGGAVRIGTAALFTPLPTEDGPYELVIPEGSCAIYPPHATHTAALDVAKALKGRGIVMVRAQTGEMVRTYDYAEIERVTKAATRGKTGRPAGRKGPVRSGESQFSRAARLLFRPEGATAKQLEDAIGWRNVSQRYANRASKLNDNAIIEVLGEKHWRLVPRKKD